MRMIAGNLLVAPLVIHAELGGKVYQIGYLRDSDVVPIPQPFWSAMREFGWVEGQNVKVNSRYAPNADQLPTLAAELVRLKVDLIMTVGSRAAQAVKEATNTIPVVFTLGDDPVERGLVANFARPGGNLTGFVIGHYEEKLLEVLKEALPRVSRVAYPVVTGPSGTMPVRRALELAGRALGVATEGITVEGPGDFGSFYTVALRDGADAVMIPNIAWFAPHLERIAAEASRSRLPAIGFDRRFVEAGGLMSYGPIESQRWPRLAAQVDKILKGTKPGDLPVELPTRFELLINAKVANSLRITITQSILLRAEVV